MPFRLPPGPVAGGASRPLFVSFIGVEASGVSASVGSTICAGVSGDDGGFGSSDDFDDFDDFDDLDEGS